MTRLVHITHSFVEIALISRTFIIELLHKYGFLTLFTHYNLPIYQITYAL